MPTNVYVRIALYILSPLLTLLATLGVGWGVSYADGVLAVHVETLAGAVIAALGLSGAVFAKWGGSSSVTPRDVPRA